ncbi:MAG: hypothetical protein OEV94_06335 [Deltaproteobacteria bacterium]|nr:hypothetical protein [Deltaproteobacteria bacterium]
MEEKTFRKDRKNGWKEKVSRGCVFWNAESFTGEDKDHQEGLPASRMGLKKDGRKIEKYKDGWRRVYITPRIAQPKGPPRNSTPNVPFFLLVNPPPECLSLPPMVSRRLLSFLELLISNNRSREHSRLDPHSTAQTLFIS